MHAKFFAAVAVMALSLAGCRDADTPAGQPSASTDAPASAATGAAPAGGVEAPLGTVVGSQAIDEATIVPVDADVLASAEWTHKDCALNSIDGNTADFKLVAADAHIFRGFVIGNDGAPAGDFSFVLKGDTSYEIPTSTGASRPDVVEFFKNPALEKAGFDFTTKLGKVPAGTYKGVFLIRRGEQKFFCETGMDIAVE
jgi:hypothetical protein